MWSWITGTAIPKLREWGETFRDDILPWIQAMVDRLRTFRDDMAPKVAGVVERLQNLFAKLREAWEKITAVYQESLGPALGRLVEALGLSESSAGDMVGVNLYAWLEGVLMIITGLVDWFSWLVDVATPFVELVGDLVSLQIENFSKIVDLVTALVEALKGFEIPDWMKDLGEIFEGLTGVDIPDWLKPGSPPPLANAIRDISAAVRDLPPLEFGVEANAGAPVMAAAGARAGAGGAARQVTITGPIHVHGVEDGQSLIEQLTEMARG